MTAALDAHGIVTGWSESAQQLLGYTPAEIIGTAVGTLLADTLPAPARHAVTHGRSWQGLISVCHRDGRILPLGVRAHPLLDAAGAVTVWYVAALHAGPVPLEAPYPAAHNGQACDPREPGEPREAGEPPVDDRLLIDWAFTQAPIGLSITDTEMRIRRLNTETARMIGSADTDLRGHRLVDALPHPAHQATWDHLRHVMATGRPARHESFSRAQGETRKRAWAVRTSPVRDPTGRLHGTFTAAIDISEQYWAQQRLTLLNEATTAIGSTLELTRTAQELADIAVPRFADQISVALLDTVYHGSEPVPGPLSAPFPLRCIGYAAALPSGPTAPLGCTTTYPAGSPLAHALTSGQPAIYPLPDPALTSWLPAPWLPGTTTPHSAMIVPLRARGTTLGAAVLTRHRHPAPFTSDDLLLADELATHTAVCLDNARRYTRERATALTLQHSLLPHDLPCSAAVDVASRYLPAGAEAGVGGDWYDVIPLSGARVALVVGDVVGHGIHAAATMGRLRTAVRTLADADPAPDELLARLDDVITRLTTDRDPTGTG
ncbi:PAS domain-containing protein, partial [Frankia sp. CiP1_Cm_nod1]|uniref:PAS domain-containing protein n=1 Tax=Frankia sp. CiP1_Cm_nod1 TaxID=2897160 RepID=UPI00202486F1